MSAIETIVSEELVSKVVGQLGYDWSRERIRRTASDVRRLVAEGYGIYAAGAAIETELLMYGDDSSPDFIGFVNSGH